MDRVKRQIAECGVRVREIDERRKELAAEIKERQQEDSRLETERDREVYAIRLLEMTLEDSEREKSWSQWNRNKRPGDPLSITVLLEQVLEQHKEGLKAPALLAELRKLGFQTNSKKPVAILTSTLHRHRPDMFTHLKDGRWCLTKNALSSASVAIVGLGGVGGSVPTPFRDSGELGRAFAAAREKREKARTQS